MKLYGIKSCNTVKKAIEWLNTNNIPFEFHDFKKLGVKPEKLEEWSVQVSWEKLINTRGSTWRQLPEEVKLKVNDKESAFELMMAKTSVIKRPVLEMPGGQIIQGFDESLYAAAIKFDPAEPMT